MSLSRRNNSSFTKRNLFTKSSFNFRIAENNGKIPKFSNKSSKMGQYELNRLFVKKTVASEERKTLRYLKKQAVL